MRTHFYEFARDDGTVVTVEYGVRGSYSPTTYSPHSGAYGGDVPEFEIIKAFSDTSDDVTLTDAEEQKVYDYLAEHYEEDEED